MMSYHVSHTRRGMSFIRPTEMENYIHETIMFMIDLLLGSDTTFIPIKSSFPSESSSVTRSNNTPSTSHHFSTNNNTGQNSQHYNQNSRYNSSSSNGGGGGGGYHDRRGASGHTQASSEMIKNNDDRSKSSSSDVIKTSDKHGLSLKDLTRELYNRGGTRPLKKLASGDSVEDRVLNFLWQHPAIFEVVGDHVSLRPMSSDLDLKVEQSLEQRTMDFILFRCKQYGECKIMISKLFGNLKQAAHDIQKHFHDYMCFYHFLARHQDVFVFLSDNFVAIRSVYDKYLRLRRLLPRCDEYIREPGVLECTDIITDLMAAQDVVNFVLRHRPVVAVDCEGVNLGAPHGDITLVQLAFVDYPYPCEYAYPIDYPHPIPDIRPYIKVFLFDVQADHRILSCYLKLILESPHHTKIFQGCASDARALRMKHNISLRCVFDTTIAHQFLRQDEIKSDLYHLYETYVKDPTNRLKKDIKKLYIGNPGLWTTRPLSELLVYYAAFDVYALLRIHDAMLKELHQHDFGRKFREIMMRSDKLAFGTVREQNMTPHVQYYQSRYIVH